MTLERDLRDRRVSNGCLFQLAARPGEHRDHCSQPGESQCPPHYGSEARRGRSMGGERDRRTVKSAGDAQHTAALLRKKWRIMCQKASKRLHREATEASSRPVLIYFDSCANSPFNYLLLRLEKHRGVRAAGIPDCKNQKSVTVEGVAVAFNHILRRTSASSLFVSSCQPATHSRGFFFFLFFCSRKWPNRWVGCCWSVKCTRLVQQ